MKKFLSKTLALSLTLAMLFSVTLAPSAFAADVGTATAIADAESVVVPSPEAMLAELQASPYAHKSYYPSSGVSSGVFHGLFSEGAVYTNLPGGTMKFAYSLYGGSQCYLRFYQGSGTNGNYISKGPYSASNNTGSDSVSLGGGTYTVVVYNPHGTSSTEVIFAFNLYTD